VIFYFTYGTNHLDPKGRSLGGSITPIRAACSDAARHKMLSARGDKWAFQYTEDEGKEQIDKWDLTERRLEEVALIPSWTPQEVYMGGEGGDL